VTTIISFATAGSGSITYSWVSASTGAVKTGTVGSSISVNAGDTVSVQASPSSGYQFDFFSASPVSSVMDAYSNPTTFIVNQGDPSFKLTAYFSLLGSTAPQNSAEPIIGSNYQATQPDVNPAQAAPANSGFYWTADHDARLGEAIPIPVDWAFWLVALLNMRNKDGLAFLKEVFKKYMDTITSVCGHLAQAGAGNILTAYGHQIIIANVLEHNYMMQAGGAGGIESVLTPLVTVSEAGSIIDGIVGGHGFDIPSTLILAGVGVPDFGRGTEAAQQETQAKAQLMRAAKGKGESGVHISDSKDVKGESSNQSIDFDTK
jgi:hypothetical protein